MTAPRATRRHILRRLAAAGTALAAATALPAQVWEVGNSVLGGSLQGSQLGRSLATGDVDGDGFTDWVAGAPADPTGGGEAGSFTIVLGGPLPSPPLAPIAGQETGARLGFELVAGDFDGDGRDEVAVGWPGKDVVWSGQVHGDAGAVRIYSVDPTGPVWEQTLTQAQTTASQPDDGDAFGWAMAAGDFDADGFADLAVGVPLEGPSDTGVVDVFYGGPGGAGSGGTALLVQPFADSPYRYGRALAVGDFDHDGFDDLAIGAPTATVGGVTDAGLVFIVHGSPSGLVDAGLFLQESMFGSTAESGDRFGWSLAAGLFDDTLLTCFTGCYDDLAIGVPFQSLVGEAAAGKVLVAYGSASGLSAAGHTVLTQQSVPTQVEAGDYFGYALASGHLDRRSSILYRIEDLAVSAIGEDYTSTTTNAGLVHLFFGAASGIGGGAPSQMIFQAPGLAISPAVPGDEMGRRLAIGDVDGDAWGDLLIGAPRKDLASPDAGAVQLLRGALFADGFESGGWALWSSATP